MKSVLGAAFAVRRFNVLMFAVLILVIVVVIKPAWKQVGSDLRGVLFVEVALVQTQRPTTVEVRLLYCLKQGHTGERWRLLLDE